MKRPAGLTLLFLLLAACGQKGALYLPDQESEAVEEAVETSAAVPTPSPASTDPAENTDEDETPRRN